MPKIVFERAARFPSMPRNGGRARGLALPQRAYARQVAPETARKMRELNFQRRKLVEQSAIDQPHCRHHEREFPSKHPPEIVRIHVRPVDHARQGMDEDIKAKV